MVKCSWGGTMTLQESFENIKDERIERCKKHNLVDILMLVFVGVLCGYKSIEQIQFYATLSEQTLKKYLKLENGIPSSDTILRVLARIDAKQLEKVFIEYAREVFGKHIAENEVVTIDGKTIRRSEYAPTGEDKRAHKAAHVVSAQVALSGCVLRAGENRRKINTSMQSIGGVVLIRWLQSALIPFVTTQSVGVLNPPHE